MLSTLIKLVLAIILAIFVHKMGHSLMCKFYTGKFLKFYIKYYKFIGMPIPYFIWYMPKLVHYKQMNIALAGFTSEIILALITIFSKNSFWTVYGFVVFIRYFLYPYYCGRCGKYNDYYWIR